MAAHRMQKPTVSIGEVARWTGLNTSAPRFYEERALVDSIRSPGNQRCYTRDGIRWVSFIPASWQARLSMEEIHAVLADLPAGRTPTREDWEDRAQRRNP